jgi:hypothetical protein
MIVQNVTTYIVNQPSKTISTSLYNEGISTDIFPFPYNHGSTGFCADNQYGPTECSLYSDQARFADAIPYVSNFPALPNPAGVAIQNMSQFILNGKSNFKATQIGAFDIFDSTNFTSGTPSSLTYFVHSNYSAVYGAPLVQTLVAQSLFKVINSSVTSSMSIYPLPYTNREASQLNSFNVDLIVTFVLLAIPWIAASFTSYAVREREVKSKHIQMVSGVSVYSYWIASWLWDFVSVSFIFAVTMIIMTIPII